MKAPAKPREFYSLKRKDAQEALERFKGKFIEHDDEHLTKIMMGYAMQAFFYHIMGDPFCVDARCCLFNARWQEEIIRAQLDWGELCTYHQKILDKLLMCSIWRHEVKQNP